MLQRIEKLEKELAELKELAKKEEPKKGDWVIMTDTYAGVLHKGEVYQVLCLQAEGKPWHTLNHDGCNSKYSPNKRMFRKATNEEIEKHLIKEAEKKGFVKGARVKGVSYAGSNFDLIIDKITISSSKGIQLWHNGEREYYEAKNLSDIELLPSCPQITINGYKAEFKEWGLDFNNGCAKIGKETFIVLAKFLQTPSPIDSNKFITTITFGKGVFTPSQIKEIAKHYETK